MHLKDIVADMPSLGIEGPLDREVSGVTYDSRRVTPGMVFVAIPGANTDGHHYIETAIDRGAAAIICEKNGAISTRATRIKVENVREALAQAATAFYRRPSSKLKVIGVTGTNGKTTVAFMVKSLLESTGTKTGLIGTVRYEIGDRVIPAQRTTPESLEIQEMMAQMVKAGCKACVMEVSSHALEQKRVLGVDFDIAIFTNLTRDHLDYHGTMDKYFEAKCKLFAALEQGGKRGAAVINIDDSFGERLAQSSKAEVVITYGCKSPAKLRATQIQLGAESSRFVVETAERTFPCRMPMIGRHNIYNALGAIGAANVLGVPALQIQAAFNAMPPVPGRLQVVSCGQPFGVYVDYAHTDDALRNVLGTLREITAGRLLLTFGCGGNRDAGKRARMGQVAAELADYTIITSDNPRKESPEKIAGQIEEGYCSVRNNGYELELNRRKAIEMIIGKAEAGDTVLIAGKGHETYQEFENTVVPFDDRVHAQEALELVGHAIH